MSTERGPPIGWGGLFRVGVGHVGLVGHAGVGWVMQRWGGSYRGGMSHAGVG